MRALSTKLFQTPRARRLARYLTAGVFSLAFCVLVLTPVFAQYGLKETGDAAGVSTTTSLPQQIGNIVKAALSMLGVVFLILTIYGGVMYMLAEGEQGKVTKARQLIYGAVIGMAIIMGSYALTSFVVTKIVGTTASP